MNNNGQIELLSIGDASLDVFVTPTELSSLCRLDSKDCLICLSYGDKIPVKSLDFSIGGNAANNAIGAKRLGLKTAIVLTVGDDYVANQIIATLDKEGVDKTYVFQQPATTSNYSTVINYMGERTILTYHAPRSYEFPVNLPPASWMYLTSMGESFRPFYNHFTQWLVKNPQTKLAFNPGSWQLKAGVEVIGEILKHSTVVFVNRQEAEKITGFGDSHGKEKDLCLSMLKLGLKICVITDGGGGAFASDGTVFLKVGVLPVDAYERTGAGDAFGSGFLSAFIKGKTLEESLLWGTINSASVIGYIGPQKGLLYEKDLPEWLERTKSSLVKVENF